MASVGTIRDQLKTRLATLSGLNAYDVWPEQPICPAALVKPVSCSFDQTMGGLRELAFEVILLAAAFDQDWDVGQDALDPYLSEDGASSIYNAIEGDVTLGSNVSSLHVVSWGDYGEIEVNGVGYWGARFTLTVWE